MKLTAFRALFSIRRPGLIVTKKSDTYPYSWWVSCNGEAVFTIWMESNQDIGFLSLWGQHSGYEWGSKEQEMAAWEADLEAKEIGRSLVQEEKKKSRSL